MSPNEQGLSYIDWLRKYPLIDDANPQRTKINEAQSAFQEVVDGKKTSSNENLAPICSSVLEILLNATKNDSAPTNEQCLNVYDYRLRDSYPPCVASYPPVSNLTNFLNENNVQIDLNVERQVNYTVCNRVIQSTFGATDSLPAKLLFPDIVSQIPIVLYNGALDILWNADDILDYLKNLTWNGAIGFDDVNNKTGWVFDHEKAGWVLQNRNLTFINVFNASHYVPYAQPKVSRYLFDFQLNQYIKNETSYISLPREGL